MGCNMKSAGIVTLGGYYPHILDTPLVYVQNIEEEGSRYKVHGRNICLRREEEKLSIDTVKFNEKNGERILDWVCRYLFLMVRAFKLISLLERC